MIPRAELYSPPEEELAQTAAIGFVIPFSTISDSSPDAIKARRKQKFNIAFQSKLMNDLVRLTTQYAASTASVMVTGESGTGKELFSRMIHEKSGRPKDLFQAFNCAAVPEPLIESEIFGHERGAFTGAIQKRAGYFERATGGTMLLDEISEIPIALQAKLLRVIEEQEVQPVGSDRPISIDVRIVATSNKNLKQEVAKGRFRADLYHRLNVLELCIPPLRERVTDVPLLTMHFVEMFRGESTDGIDRVTKEAMQQLCSYHWPGNVRELRNVIHRACIVSENREINVQALPELIPSDPPSTEIASHSFTGMSLADIERQLIIACLEKFAGNKKSAAAELGVTARTLSNKLKLYQEQGFPCQW
jgi:DNA-binding NtrC family response regulator